MNFAVISFLVLAVIGVAAALGMLFSRNSIYSAIFLVANFVTIAVIYLTLGAPFIALVQVTVYAGAIMVLFLFVIMLLGVERLPIQDTNRWQRPLAIVLALALLGEILYVNLFRAGIAMPIGEVPANFGSPTDIGLTLFNNYLLPFEVTSVLLLIAAIGAIVLSGTQKRPKPNRGFPPEHAAAQSAAQIAAARAAAQSAAQGAAQGASVVDEPADDGQARENQKV